MKKHFGLILIMLFTLSCSAQIVCYDNEYIDKRPNNSTGSNANELFTGIIVNKNGKETKIYYPFSVKEKANRRLDFVDLNQNRFRLTPSYVGLSNMNELKNEIYGCIERIRGGSGGGSSFDENAFDSLLNIRTFEWDKNGNDDLKTERDPTVPQHVKDIRVGDISRWQTALQSEGDPTVPTHVKDIKEQDITYWNEPKGALEKLTEGNNTGYRLRFVEPANYGTIGIDAVDFSISSSASSTRGATGYHSVAMGLNARASGQSSIALGRNCQSTQYASIALGEANAYGRSSFAVGEGTTVYTRGGASLGAYPTLYFGSATGWELNVPALTVGIGDGNANRKNGLTVFRNGANMMNPITHTQAALIPAQEGMEIFVSSVGGVFTDIGRYSYSNGQWRFMEATGGGGGGSTPDPTYNLGYLQNYSVDSLAATNIAPVYGVHPPFNSRSISKRYKGKYDRMYSVYSAIEGGKRVSRIFWYDYDTKQLSPSYKIGIDAPNTDTHNIGTINIDADGHILIITVFDDSTINIAKSNFSELDNNGAVDVTHTLLPAATALTTYSNYVSSAYMGSKLVLEWRGNSSSAPTQEHRAIVSSDDNGTTFNPVVDWLNLNSNHWAYGAMFPDQHRGGVFMTVGMQNNSNKAYPVWGIVWTKDLVNFGGMEYYRSNGTSGWSKNVSTNGSINETEFLANLAVVNDDINSNTNHYSPKIEQLGDGSLVVHTCDGTRTTVNNITGYVTSIYDITNNTWTHNTAALTDFPIPMSSAHAPIVYTALIPMDKENMRMIVRGADNSGNLLKSNDGGKTWAFEVKLSNANDALGESNYTHTNKEAYVLIQNGTQIKVVRFGDTLLNQNDGQTNTQTDYVRKDLFVTDGNNIILKSPNGTCYSLSVDNAGVLSTTAVTCPQ